MKCLIFFGLLVLCGLALCEDLPEEQNDEVADAENEMEDPSQNYGYGKGCKTTGYKKVCDLVHQCYPYYFYVKAYRYVRTCKIVLLKGYKKRKQCRKFCWNEGSTKYNGYYKAYNSKHHGKRVCARRCYRVRRTKRVCYKKRLSYLKWASKTVCRKVKSCYKVPHQKCGHGHY